MQSLTPKDHAERIALYRSEIVGSLTRRELAHGELAEALTELAKTRFRPPRSHSSRAYSIATLERWYYAYKDGGLAAPTPTPRTDRGRGRDLDPSLRDLLVAIREEHPSASVPLVLRTLINEGKLDARTVSALALPRLRGHPRLALLREVGPDVSPTVFAVSVFGVRVLAMTERATG